MCVYNHTLWLRPQPFCVFPGIPLEYHGPDEEAMQILSVEAGIRYVRNKQAIRHNTQEQQ